MLITTRFLGCLVSRTTRIQLLCYIKVIVLKLETKLEEKTKEIKTEYTRIKDILKLEKLKLVILIEKLRILKLEMLIVKLEMLKLEKLEHKMIIDKL